MPQVRQLLTRVPLPITRDLNPSILAIVRNIYAINSRHTVWTVDTEFESLKDADAVPCVLTIRNANTDAIVLPNSVQHRF